MPNTKSYRKTMKTDAKKRLRNRAARTTLRGVIRKFLEVCKSGDLAAAQTAYSYTTKRLDQMAAKKFIHKNKASRLKSRLSTRLPKTAPAAG